VSERWPDEKPILSITQDDEGDYIVRDHTRPGCLCHWDTLDGAIAHYYEAREQYDAALAESSRAASNLPPDQRTARNGRINDVSHVTTPLSALPVSEEPQMNQEDINWLNAPMGPIGSSLQEKALAFLEREGYRRCDIPACNCGSWHKHEAAEEPRREEPDKLLRIAGLVNGYHNDGTKLSAAETLAAIADVLGDPFDFSSSAVVVGADQQVLIDNLESIADDTQNKLLAFDRQELRRAAKLLRSPALPDPGSPEREKERTERR
jgi:hypothetical protein